MTFYDWVKNPTFEYEDEYVQCTKDGVMIGKPLKDVFLYSKPMDPDDFPEDVHVFDPNH